jgi:hypothetical protein
MKNNKIRSYLISGIFLIFVALKDIEHFYIFYEGIALGLGVTALILAGIEYMNRVDQEK